MLFSDDEGLLELRSPFCDGLLDFFFPFLSCYNISVLVFSLEELGKGICVHVCCSVDIIGGICILS